MVEALVLDLPSGEPRPLRSRLTTTVLPGEQPACKGEVRDVRDAELTTQRQHVLVVVAPKQAVVVLEHREASGAVLAGDPVRLGQLLGGEVGAADRADLPLPHELVERPERLNDRRRG